VEEVWKKCGRSVEEVWKKRDCIFDYNRYFWKHQQHDRTSKGCEAGCETRRVFKVFHWRMILEMQKTLCFLEPARRWDRENTTNLNLHASVCYCIYAVSRNLLQNT
jgi:hypothetical protein